MEKKKISLNFMFKTVVSKPMVDNGNNVNNDKYKSCVMNTTAGYIIMFIQNDVMTCKDII